MRIERVTEAAEVHLGAALFDDAPRPEATARFLAEPGHHLLFAYDDDARPVGMVSGVETTHPDKGTEMLLYELSVAPEARRRGVATALVGALAEIAERAKCYGMWVAVDTDNEAALATYRRTGAHGEPPSITLSWSFSGARP